MPTTMQRRLVLLATWFVLPAAAAAQSDLRLVDAVKRQDNVAVSTLLSQGVDANALQPDGSTALHWAAYLDDTANLGSLIRAGANVNVQNSFGATALWLASEQAGPATVRALLDAGADPNLALPNGETPLMTAARSGNHVAVSALLTRGANVNAVEKSRSQTALMWAVAQRHPEITKLLIEHGANVNARSEVRMRMIKLAGNGGYAETGFAEEAQGGFTPLLFAARVGDAESARLLIAAGASVNDATPSATSALVVAIHSGNPGVAAVLLEGGADVDSADRGYTALHAAVVRGEDDSVKLLLSHGANPNTPLRQPTPVRRRAVDWAMSQAWLGATPFWLAAKFSEVNIMQLLISKGADPHISSDRGVTPLMAAVLGTIDRLGDAPPDGNYRPALDPAKEDRDTIRAIGLALGLGLDVNETNEAGDTALHIAAGRRMVAVAEYLIENGARVDAKNKRGDTPLAAANRPQRGEDGETADSGSERRSTKRLIKVLESRSAQ